MRRAFKQRQHCFWAVLPFTRRDRDVKFRDRDGKPRDRDETRDPGSRDRDETEMLLKMVETRRDETRGASRDRLETETSRPRAQPCSD